MKQIYCEWTNEEVKKLFNFVEDGKLQNKNLSEIFKEYAKMTNRKPNSVRNYYYAELRNLEENIIKRDKLRIDISKHIKCEQKSFSDEETKQSVCEILKLIDKGYSVRKACLCLANGDINEMVRYQNKYRTLLKNEPEFVIECKNELRNKGQLKLDNIIKIREKPQRLLESDINSLFLGLVKLVKKQAIEQFSSEYKTQNEKANEQLRRCLIEIANKENEIKKLRRNFRMLKMQNNQINKKLSSSRAKNAEYLANNNSFRMQSLKKYAKSIKDEQKLNPVDNLS